MTEWWRKKEEDDRKLAVEEPGEHFLDLPHCPNCGQPDHEWWDYSENSLKNDGDSTERDCHSCEKPYRVVMCVSTSFKTSKVQP
jgi:hypothetical protein